MRPYMFQTAIPTTLTEGLMPFRPNYRQDRLERDRAARARTDEKQRKRDEKNAKLNAPRPKVHRMMKKLNMQAYLRQKACPRTDCLREQLPGSRRPLRSV